MSGLAVTGTESATIESGATLELGASDSQTITFATDTGTLKLDSPSTFTGQIAGFTGTAADAADSDEVELTGVWTTTSDLTGTGGNLVVNLTEGSKTATLTFADFSGTLNISNNGSETFIFDPPATNSGAPVSIGGPGNDNFIFHPSLGADSGNSHALDDAAELERLSAAQAQHWSPLIGNDAHADAIEFVHHSDGTMPPDSNAAHWHLAMHNAVNLH